VSPSCGQLSSFRPSSRKHASRSSRASEKWRDGRDLNCPSRSSGGSLEQPARCELLRGQRKEAISGKPVEARAKTGGKGDQGGRGVVRRGLARPCSQIGDEQRDHKDVRHRPFGDQFNKIEGALPARRVGGEGGAQYQRNFAERHDDAEEQDERRGQQAAYLVKVPHRARDAAGLLENFDFPGVVFQRGHHFRGEFFDDGLAQIAAGGLEEGNHRGVHH